MKYRRRGGGYYFNVGCSDLIVDGSIKLQHFENIDRFVADGVRLKDGSMLAADLIVTAAAALSSGDYTKDSVVPGPASIPLPLSTRMEI